MARINIYIDGFNLYYGALKGGPFRWLDLESYFKKLRTADEIQRIYYFTALVDAPSKARQEAYLRALSTLPLVTVILGRFKQRKVKCGVPPCSHGGDKWFNKPEEKGTDVNVAVQMLDDAYQDTCDKFVLISGDSDLVPSVNKIKLRFPQKKVVVYVPTRDRERGAAVELRSAADDHRDLPLAILKVAQFPSRVPDGVGGFIIKPPPW